MSSLLKSLPPASMTVEETLKVEATLCDLGRQSTLTLSLRRIAPIAAGKSPADKLPEPKTTNTPITIINTAMPNTKVFFGVLAGLTSKTAKFPSCLFVYSEFVIKDIKGVDTKTELSASRQDKCLMHIFKAKSHSERDGSFQTSFVRCFLASSCEAP